MSTCLERQFLCSKCGEKTSLLALLNHPSPFRARDILQACPNCLTVIAEEHDMAHLALACSHGGCDQTPIGSDDRGWWCQLHQPQ
jgi:hypothetical protein